MVSPVLAVSPTPTGGDISPTKKPTPTQSVQDSQIEKIKDLVASRVAELKLVDKRGIIGRVKSSTNSQITLVNTKGKQILVDIDELTKFESAGASFGISDIKAGDSLSIVGLFNKQTERLLARFAEKATNIPENVEAVVIAKDIRAFTLNVVTTDGKRKTINVETSTKTSSYAGGETLKSGFSKIKPGERIIVVGFPDKSAEDELNASRLIHFQDIALSAQLTKAKDLIELEETVTPTP